MVPTPPSKGEIDRLGDRLRSDPITDDHQRALDGYRRGFSDAYDSVIGVIRTDLAMDPTGRIKTASSIVEKLRREPKMKLAQMQDIAGCRVVVADITRQDEVVERPRRLFPQAREVDRRAKPSHGYRAVHLIARISDRRVEVQVRTELQHVWAQTSERVSDVIDPSIKYGGAGGQISEILMAFSAEIGLLESWAERGVQVFSRQPDLARLSGTDADSVRVGVDAARQEIIRSLLGLSAGLNEIPGG